MEASSDFNASAVFQPPTQIVNGIRERESVRRLDSNYVPDKKEGRKERKREKKLVLESSATLVACRRPQVELITVSKLN